MSIDKESNGLPEVNVHRRTTKVNLWMIAAVVFFLALMAVAAVWISRSSQSTNGVLSTSDGSKLSTRP